MNMVVNALLGSHAQGQHAEQHSTIVGVSPQKTPWVEKQRRLLKKRSSEPDAEAALVSHQASSSSSCSRDTILALYGVKMKDACSPSSPKGTMVDLTLDDSSPDVQKRKRPAQTLFRSPQRKGCQSMAGWICG